MTLDDLRDEIAVELALLEATVAEASALLHDVGPSEATIRERTAAAAFLTQFYGGIENILKRLCRFHRVPLPVGETWHVDLFRSFCAPPVDSLPLLFDGWPSRSPATGNSAMSSITGTDSSSIGHGFAKGSRGWRTLFSDYGGAWRSICLPWK